MKPDNNRLDLLWFFIITVVFSWALWIPLAFAKVYVRDQPWLIIMELGGLSPSLVGILFILKRHIYTKQTFKDSFLSFRRIGIINLIFALSLVIAAFFFSILMDYIFFNNIPSTTRLMNWFSGPLAFIIAFVSFIYSGPITEEFGWRAYVAKLMLKKYSFLSIGLIIGSIWSVWHYPLFFLNGQYNIDNLFVYIPIHLIYHISLTLIILYLYIITNGSVLLSIIIHMVSNVMANSILPRSYSSYVIQTTLLLVISIGLIIKMNGLSLSIWRRPADSA